MSRFIFLLLLPLASTPAADGQWKKQSLKTEADFRGLCVVDAKTVWVSGTQGTFALTTDAGTTWSVGQVPGAESLDFRDVKAFSDRAAYLMSAGKGSSSRIYKTTDGGKNWKLQFQATDSETFLDALGFWDETHGIAVGDPVNGRFQIWKTEDGVQWNRAPEENCPETVAGEGAFAASGSCLVTVGKNEVWLGTGGAPRARLFHSTNRGEKWTVQETPLPAGVESSGIFSLHFPTPEIGMMVGGDYKKPEAVGPHAAFTRDGGKSWKCAEKSLPYRSSVAWTGEAWVAVGTSGSDITTNEGATWKRLDAEKANSVRFTPQGDGWVAGPKGYVAKFSKESEEIAAVRTLLDEQQKAWNRGDLDGFMAGYWKSPELKFYSGGTITTGWKETAERYHKRYKAEGKEMGQLTFSDVEIELLAPQVAVVRGRWKVQLAQEAPEGLYTLIVKKRDGEWKVVSDHTSVAEKK